MKQSAKKALKITGITLGSIIGFVLLVVLIACWIVFSSGSLTRIADKAIAKYAPCEAKVDKVDLTLVGSFPFLGFRLNGLVVYDEMEDSPSDTLASIDELTVTVDFKTFYKEKKIILTGLFIDGVRANLFTAADGRSNLDFIMSGEEKPEDDESGDTDIYADLQKIALTDVGATYIDLSSGMNARVNGLGLDLKGLLKSDSIDAGIGLKIAAVNAAIQNDTTNLKAALDGLSLDGKCSKYGPEVALDANMKINAVNAAMDSLMASISKLAVGLDKVSCLLTDDGVKDLKATVRLDGKSIQASQEGGMDVKLDNLAIAMAQAAFDGDSLNVDALSLKTGGLVFNNGMVATLSGIDLGLDAGLKTDMSNVNADLVLGLSGLQYMMDSMIVNAGTVNLSAGASVNDGQLAVTPTLSIPSLDFDMNGEKFVPGWPVRMELPLETTMDFDRVRILNGSNITVNGERIGLAANATLGNSISGSASVSTRNMEFDKLISMIPASFQSMLDGIDLHGSMGFDINVNGSTDNLRKADAKIYLANLDVCMNDSLYANSNHMTVKATYPSSTGAVKGKKTADVSVDASDLDVTMVDSTTIKAALKGMKLDGSVIGLTDPVAEMTANVNLSLATLDGSMDTIDAKIDGLDVKAKLSPSDGKMSVAADVAFADLLAHMGPQFKAALGKTAMHATVLRDESKDDVLLQWNPNLKLSLANAKVDMKDMLELPVELPKLELDFTLGRFNINECNVKLGNSDITLWGDVYNIDQFIDKTGLLTGELFLESEYTDVTQIMALTSDKGGESKQVTEVQAGDTISTGPFMVPKGIDLTLFTNLANIDFNGHKFHNVGGDVTVRDGVVILQELGFSSDAAEMQLTAIYKTPSLEDRFTELDFHLLDIEIDELIDLIPAVDSIVPMLKTFSGKAAFHLAAECFLEPDTKKYGDYFPVMSTLIGDAAIEGKNLVVLDNEVFNSIKKKLLMSSDARNVIDSLDVELQVLRNKVDLYPTRIRMDKYEAIIGGRHNLNDDMSCSYHISLTDCPLPVRLGVTVSGPLNDISKNPLKHISVGKPKYNKLYNPKKQGNLEESVLKMKQDILDTMRSNVK